MGKRHLVRVASTAFTSPPSATSNRAGIGAFREQLSKGRLDLDAIKQGVDGFGVLNSNIIAMEIPNTLLPRQIAVYATSAMYNVDTWEQVNRLANPLMTHLFMYNSTMEVAEHVGHRPDRDNTRKYVFTGNVLRAVVLDGKPRIRAPT